MIWSESEEAWLNRRAEQIGRLWPMQARFRIALAKTAAIAGLGLLHSPFATAGQTASVDHSVADAAPLSDDDLRFITDHVLTQNPLMSSSPGIKFAAAQRSGVYDLASVIYYPHIDRAGFKEAFQVQCRRQVPKEPRVCGDAEIRRYLQIDSQDFEVRVTGGISSDAALALISATRDALQANAADDANIPQTAIMIISDYDSALVTWGDSKGHQDVALEARLREGGSPINPDDWRSKTYVPGE